METQARRIRFAGWLGPAILWSAMSFGQTADDLPPFIGGPPTVFDVERVPMDSGQLLGAKRYVSEHDRKYVTYGSGAAGSSTASLALQEVEGREQIVQVGRLGYVGGILPAGPKLVSTTLPLRGSPVKTSPQEIGQVGSSSSVYDRRGIFFVSPLK